MKKWMEKFANDLRGELEELSAVLELEKDFLQSLLLDSDWSFVIKLHAVFEAALVQTLVGRLGEESLGEVFGFLDTSDKRRGKIAFARALEVLDSNECRYLIALSTLRNSLIHEVRNVGFSFANFVDGLDKEQMNAFVSAITLTERPKPEDDDWRDARRDAGSQPKETMWLSGMSILVLMFIRRKFAISQREVFRMRAETYELQEKNKPIGLSQLLSSFGTANTATERPPASEGKKVEGD